ncbi:MAG: hypothetical protein Q8922_12420 [Bacteroidota bacterium]|nr:hypothetical protein [Bacteroidota bacterium]MDP4288729.1 hypothetical protein [Bacteroidota bacterium]
MSYSPYLFLKSAMQPQNTDDFIVQILPDSFVRTFGLQGMIKNRITIPILEVNIGISG